MDRSQNQRKAPRRMESTLPSLPLATPSATTIAARAQGRVMTWA